LGDFSPRDDDEVDDGNALDCVEKPFNWPFVEKGFVEAFGLTGVERAFGEATKLARRQPLAPAAAPSRNFLRRVSGLANCEAKIGVLQHNTLKGGHCRTAECKMQRFKSPGSAQKFLSTHAAVYNTFNAQGHLTSAQTHRTLRAAAMGTWRTAVAAA